MEPTFRFPKEIRFEFERNQLNKKTDGVIVWSNSGLHTTIQKRLKSNADEFLYLQLE